MVIRKDMGGVTEVGSAHESFVFCTSKRLAK